jgi:hypothetical protein
LSRNGSGTYSLPAGNPVVTGTTVSSTWANNTLNDLASAMTQSLAADGQTTPTADLPMGGFKHLDVGDALTRDQYPSYAQVQDNKPAWGGTAGGTADALTIGPSVGVSAYATGQSFEFIAASANTTTTPTISVSGLAAKTIVDRAGTTLEIGAIQPGLCLVEYDGTNFRLFGVRVINSTSSTSTTFAASAAAVKSAYDLATTVSNKTSYVYKTITTSRSSTTTLADDPDLTLSLVSGQNYDIEIVISYQGAAIGPTNPQGIKFTLNYTGTFTNSGAFIANYTGGTTGASLAALFSQSINVATITGSTTQDVAVIKAAIKPASNGTLSFQWSQNSSSGTATKVLGESFMRVTKLP